MKRSRNPHTPTAPVNFNDNPMLGGRHVIARTAEGRIMLGYAPVKRVKSTRRAVEAYVARYEMAYGADI